MLLLFFFVGNSDSIKKEIGLTSLLEIPVFELRKTC